MSIRLDINDGPGLEALRNFTFETRSSIPIKHMPLFRARGLTKKKALELKLEGEEPVRTFAEGAGGYCVIRLEHMVNFVPQIPSDQLWWFTGYGRITGGEGPAYDAWLQQPEFRELREHSRDIYLVIDFRYSTLTRSGFVLDIRALPRD